jgi:hypothetical protein
LEAITNIGSSSTVRTVTSGKTDHYATALRQLADEIGAATGRPDNWTSHDGAYHSDTSALAFEVPEWGAEAKTILHRAVWDCTKYVSAANRHAYGIAALVDQQEVFLSPWPLLRAQLEAGGRVTWLLEPHTKDGTGVGPKRRCARWFLEQFASVCYQHEALKALKSKHKPAAKRRRSKTADEIERLFGTRLEWTGLSSELEWVIGPDRYLSLASGCRLFATHLNDSMTGMYPVLSGYSHPSLQFIDEVLVENVTNDGFRRTNWLVEPEMLHRFVAWSGGLTYRTATGMLSYLDGRQDLLEVAMDRFEHQLREVQPE